MSRWSACWPFAVFAVVVAVLLGPSLAGQRVTLPTDLLLERAPWSVTTPAERPRNVELRDQIDTYYPIQHELVQRLRHREDAGWLDRVGIGLPGALFVGWGLWSPFNALAAVADFPTAWVWGMALRLFAAMCGAYLLTRRLGAGRLGGTVAGITYGLSGFMVLWLGWPQSHVAALAPMVLWATERTVAGDARWWHGPLLGVSVAGLWLGGFPSVAAYTLVAAGVVAVHAVWQRRADPRRDLARGLLSAAVGVATGTGLAAFTLAPSMRILGEFALGYRDLAWQTSIPLQGLLTFVTPGFFGDVVHHDLWLGASYVESVGYTGAVTLLLAAAAIGMAPRHRGVGLYGGLALTFAALAYGFPPLRWLLSVVPLLRSNVPTRSLALVGLGLAVLGGLGADALERRLRGEVAWDRRTIRRLLATAAGAAAAFMAVRPPPALRRLAYARLSQEAAQRATDVAMRELLTAAGLMALAAVVAAIAMRRARDGRDGQRVLALGLLVVVAVDLLSFAGGWNVQTPRTDLFPDAPGLSDLGLASGDHRVAGAQGVLLPNTHLEYGIADVRAHGFATPRFDQVLTRLGADRASPTNWSLTTNDSGRWMPWLALLGVQQVLVAGDVPELGSTTVQFAHDQVDEPLWGSRGYAFDVLAPQSGMVRGVLLRAGTYGRENAGALTARVTAKAGTGTGRLDVQALSDLRWAAVPTSPIAVTEGEPLRIEIGSTSTDPESAVTLFGAVLSGRFVPGAALRYDSALRSEPVPAAPGLRRVLIPEALPFVFAASRAVAVAPGAALDLIDRLGAEGLQGTVAVEPYGGGRVPSLPGGGHAEVFSYERGGGRVLARVTSERGAVVVSLDQALDGWKATVDGEEAAVVRAHHLFIGVVVPPGLHTVELRYEAPLQQAGALTSVRSVGALLAWAGLRRLRERTGKPALTVLRDGWTRRRGRSAV